MSQAQENHGSPYLEETAKPAAAAKGPSVDSTLTKGLRILETLAASPRPIGVSELSRELGLTKSNVFRLLQTLSVSGYVTSTKDRRYRATMKVWQVGHSVADNIDLRDLAQPVMQRMSESTHETIYLAVPDGLNIIYLDKIDSDRPIRSATRIGGGAPIHCVGTGKAILAQRYPRMRERLAGNLQKYTDRTITTIRGLDAEMAETRARGYAIDTGEFHEGIRSYGAAICLPDGRPIGAIGISVPEVNLRDGDEDRYCELVRSAAISMTRQLASS